MLGVEAGGEGIKQGKHAARFQAARSVCCKARAPTFCRTEKGRFNSRTPCQPDWITRRRPGARAGCTTKSASSIPTPREQALNAFGKLARLEGIIPALESSHAIAACIERAPKMSKDQLVIVNLSGRGELVDCNS